METEAIDKQLETALEMYDQGKTYSDIREHMKDQKFSQDEISYIIRLVDEFALEESKNKAKIQILIYKMIFGSLLFIISVLTAIQFYNNEELSGIISYIIYIPILIALWIIWRSWKEKARLQHISPEIDDTKLRFERTRKRKRS